MIGEGGRGRDATDDDQSLAERLLPLEHRLLPAVLSLLAERRLRWKEQAPWLDGKPLTAPLVLTGHGLQHAE